MNGHSFRFADDTLQRDLVRRLIAAGVAHSIGKDGVVLYASRDREVVEDDLICAAREAVFSAWQIATCPRDWIARYREYMARHDVPFVEEWSDGELWFLIPRKYRPHAWKMEGPVREQRLVETPG